MFFEGSEKRVEIIINNPKYSLINNLSDVFWSELIDCSQAKILSKIDNKQCKAFILSESSLFVWHNRFVILTCGVTGLVNSVEYFVQQMGKQSIGYLTYQRKNEYYSKAQPTSFSDDIKKLKTYVEGDALRLGDMDSNHVYLFHKKEGIQHKHFNKSYEFFAYQISDKASNELTRRNLKNTEIRKFLRLDYLLEGFDIDDHVFEPYGYSINAIKADEYITIHVTPQAESSYVSIESNVNLSYLIPSILNVLQPQTFDLLCFNDDVFDYELSGEADKKYSRFKSVSRRLNNGMFVCYSNYVYIQAKNVKVIECNVIELYPVS
ncbi:hypothetical protein [Pseudocolwellia agarivorans]|uniref:hypothetical protein n=1 Tax=Pseudocolwellia agarivorans TaxID=1911682 RepID=UPI0009848A67|nr:hypothetical protein [Pseudocolwellia agarivorans]